LLFSETPWDRVQNRVTPFEPLMAKELTVWVSDSDGTPPSGSWTHARTKIKLHAMYSWPLTPSRGVAGVGGARGRQSNGQSERAAILLEGEERHGPSAMRESSETSSTSAIECNSAAALPVSRPNPTAPSGRTPPLRCGCRVP